MNPANAHKMAMFAVFVFHISLCRLLLGLEHRRCQILACACTTERTVDIERRTSLGQSNRIGTSILRPYFPVAYAVP